MNDHTSPDEQLAEARATNRRLNLRAQRLESELAAYRRAVADWEISDASAYVPLRSLAVIAKAAGIDVPARWELHYERLERAEAAAVSAVRPPATAQETCPCGRTPDPGICPTTHDGRRGGGHCSCVHESKDQPATDRTALRERIAAAVRTVPIKYGSDSIEPVSVEEADVLADAVLAVLPEPADRAAVLREAADAAEQTCIHGVTPAASERDEIWDQAVRAVATMLRRLAADPAAAGPDQTDDTLPAWLYQRFMQGGEGWDNLDADQRAYWEHQARAVRRAVERGGFRTAAAPDQTQDRHACRNCEGVDPDTCLMNPDRPAASRPRCPDCQMPHDLTPGSLPVAMCQSVRRRIAEAELRTLRAGIRSLGGDPTTIQNLWAQLRLRNRQWKEATDANTRVRLVACDPESYEDAADVIRAVCKALDGPALTPESSC